MEKPALLNIDYTYDFVAEDGKLTSGEPGQAIEGKIVALTKQFIEAGEYVVFAWFVANINFSVKKQS